MRHAIVVFGMFLIMLGTGAAEFVLLLFHSQLLWAVVPLLTLLLYGFAWFGSRRLSHTLALLSATAIGTTFATECLIWGAPGLATLQFAIASGVSLAGALLIRHLRRFADNEMVQA